jgi:hypothetical protein
MYTIKQTAARTGLNVPTIRAWERRYGVVHPARTAAGYRLYDDTAIARLTAMRRLVDDEGWRPSQASQEVLAAGDDLAALGAIGRPQVVDVPGRTNGVEPSAESIDAFLEATTQLDVPAIEDILDGTFANQRFERAMDDVVFPALRGVGERWSTGEVDVAAEHAASETVRRRLAGLYEAAGRPSSWGCRRAVATSSERSVSPSRRGGRASTCSISGPTSRSRAGCEPCAKPALRSSCWAS